MSPCRYRALSSRNATSMARRFRDLAGLSFLLTSEVEALGRTQADALRGLQDLRVECRDPSPDLVDQAAHCGRCLTTTSLLRQHETRPILLSRSDLRVGADVQFDVCILNW